MHKKIKIALYFMHKKIKIALYFMQKMIILDKSDMDNLQLRKLYEKGY